MIIDDDLADLLYRYYDDDLSESEAHTLRNILQSDPQLLPPHRSGRVSSNSFISQLSARTSKLKVKHYLSYYASSEIANARGCLIIHPHNHEDHGAQADGVQRGAHYPTITRRWRNNCHRNYALPLHPR